MNPEYLDLSHRSVTTDVPLAKSRMRKKRKTKAKAKKMMTTAARE
jgi:hypothetical protein